APLACRVHARPTRTSTPRLGPHPTDTAPRDTPSTATTQASNPAPVVTAPSVDKTTLRPANHQMVPVTVAYSASGNCGATACSLSVASNEPVNGSDDGDTAPDWQIVDEHHALMRA